MASLALINSMMRLYFRLNTLRNCKALIKSVSAPNFPKFDAFPKAHRVTYKFFSGRLALFDDHLVRFLEVFMGGLAG